MFSANLSGALAGDFSTGILLFSIPTPPKEAASERCAYIPLRDLDPAEFGRLDKALSRSSDLSCASSTVFSPALEPSDTPCVCDPSKKDVVAPTTTVRGSERCSTRPPPSLSCRIPA